MWTILTFAKSPDTKPGNLAGHRFTRPEGLVQWESMLVIDTPPGTNAKWFSQGRVPNEINSCDR